MQVLLTTTRAWHLPSTGKAFSQRGPGRVVMADKTRQLPRTVSTVLAHICMKPFYHGTQIDERATFLPAGICAWMRAQLRSASAPV
jgi:hypothetical protein